MGYAVLHIDKVRGSDSAMSAHVKRTFVPNNVDVSRTHLNRDLVQFPANVTNRTEAIAHRIATAGIYRKVADNQVKALVSFPNCHLSAFLQTATSYFSTE